jgi:hypothetical protein
MHELFSSEANINKERHALHRYHGDCLQRVRKFGAKYQFLARDHKTGRWVPVAISTAE